jgi:ATP-dependent helicase/nuclease subunit B
LAAHDFVQGFCAEKVVMTRSEKVGGSPTVPARWLDRLDAVLHGADMDLNNLSRHPYNDWARLMDDHDDFRPYARPKPKPPVSARPKGVSVTKFENWMQNPYEIYMHYVLRLRKIRPLLQDNDAALRGNVTHKIIERFCEEFPLQMPDDAEGELIRIARGVLREDIESPEALHYWWPKFMRLAAWFAEHEEKWRENAKFGVSEVRGNIDIDIDGAAFNLYGIADRIDRMQGGYALIDYKTGKGALSRSRIKDGKLPQLPLEALILKGGGFNGRGFKFDPADMVQKRLAAGDTAYMGYWILNGKGVGGELIEANDGLDEAIETVLEGVQALVRVFRDADTPYLCVPNTANAPRFNDYEHVSRLKEWAALDDAESDATWD